MNNVFSFIENLLHCIKEVLLSILPPEAVSKSMKVNLRLRAAVLFGTFSAALLISGYYLYPVLMSLGFFLICLYVVLFFCHHIFNRGWIRNLLFMIIFCTGVYSYIKLSDACSQTAVVSVEKQVETASENNRQNFYRKLLQSAYYSHIVTGAFFPSRGTYEIASDGTICVENKPKIALPNKVLWFYLGFHASVYIFVGYFIMSLWGYRTINRMRFWLLRDCEKCIFWCIIPEPKMMQLAKDVKNANKISMPIFSVEATATDDAKTLFQEMNYQYFCLKLRNPDQIHNQCLRAAKHFFLSENVDWNIKMAEALLSKRQNIKNTAKIYIRINSDSRKVYYTRWAEKYCSNAEEIIFIDECALIVDKFITKHHLLASGITVNEDTSIDKPDGFNFLLLGFGGLGQDVLKHLICDSRFIGSDGKLVKFHADIVDQDAKKLSLFMEQFKVLCNHDVLNVQLDFHRRDAGGGCFYTFLEESLLKQEQKYDRIIIALGNPELNIETAAQIENIIRKNINLAHGYPSEELKLWKRKIFLVSPEVKGSLVGNDNNIFTLIGADNEIFTWADIVNEEMFERAKLVNFRYTIDHSIKEEKKRIAAMRKWLPQRLVKIWSAKEFRNKVENEWTKADFYSRRSSYAAALGLENIKFLLRDRSFCKLSENTLTCLGKMEHYRWWAFMLGEGYVTWQNPEPRLGILAKANQTKNFLRHATMVDWEKLPDMDGIFAQGKTFQEIDYELIEGLPDFFEKSKADKSNKYALNFQNINQTKQGKCKMQKQNVIIFSSFQSLELVKKLKAGIEEQSEKIEVVNWEEYFNQVYPKDYGREKAFPLFRFLTKRVPSFDFAILIAGGEDEIHRGVNAPGKKVLESYFGMRDNVIFELGMCCMALGESRVILLHKEGSLLFPNLGAGGQGVDMPLTIENIQLKAFDYSDKSNVKELSRKIVDYIGKKSDDYSPVVVGAACSTAQGYMDNFIMSAFNAFRACREGKENFVLEIAGKKPEVFPGTLEFRILLPTADACKNVPEILSDTKTASASIYNYRKCKISNGEIKPPKGRSVLFACKQKGNTLQIIDIPTTFQASYKTAEAILGIKDDAISDAERSRYITKEISMFDATLRKLIQQANDQKLGLEVAIEYVSFDCDVDRKNLPWLYE